jgi:putative oxidoreductase
MESSAQRKSQGLHISLWIAQGILALMFLMAGFMKSTSPIDELSKNVPWAIDVPEWLLRFIGASEFLAALGLILPSILKIKPRLTPVAASALATVMVLAIFFHVSRSEFPAIGFNAAIGAVAIFIAWGRFAKEPILPKGQI